MEVIVIIGLVVGGIIFLLGLSCCIFGFGPVGVAASSCAACCQSCIGNVVSGSCFAILTSLGMRGCFVGMIIIGLLILIGFGIYYLIEETEIFSLILINFFLWLKKDY